METRNSGAGVVRMLGARRPPAEHPTVRLAEGGDADTYDADTIAAVLDEHTDHLRKLERRLQQVETDRNALWRYLAYPPWVRAWRDWRYGPGWWL